MPQIILGPNFSKLDGSVRKAAFAFLEKLQDNDANPSLHIERINGSADGRIRTGRVDGFWRAVLVKIQVAIDDAYYIYLGTYPHDDAIAFAKTAVVRVNPYNKLAELLTADRVRPQSSERAANKAKPRPDDVDMTTYPLLETQGIGLDELLALGIDEPFAAAALTAETEDALLELAAGAPAAWQSDAVLDLATGTGLENVQERLGLKVPVTHGDTGNDQDLLEALRRPASGMDFAFIEDDGELRAAIEDDDFGRWRVFLHPEQREYAFKERSGSFRLSGGAGTGKTVVLLHRARHLVRCDPAARIVLTTFNKTLAASLAENLRLLDPAVPFASELGQPGVYVASVDAIARRVLARGGSDLASAIYAVLGQRPPYVLDSSPGAHWEVALATAGGGLDEHLRHPSFMISEYGSVILPNRVTTRDEYLRVRRLGRGTALSRAQRIAVWEVVAAYRASTAAAGSTDWDEKSMIAGAHLDAEAAIDGTRVADHVLVDEAQDLAPTRLHLLRALASAGPDDLFIADDTQQRIYGPRVVLSRYGINVRGRSRRLTLNYRTTAQVLRYAVGVLAGESWIDLEAADASAAGYRSARTARPPTTAGCGGSGSRTCRAPRRARRGRPHRLRRHGRRLERGPVRGHRTRRGGRRAPRLRSGPPRGWLVVHR
ncbi:UvrD-helicase domain-containing protein [Cellulosimicrobium cellulans]|uniref:UvrD-helicase domain-containing protein n=1 Tax=Cellulosimicrobium cellulans TaxID=1710 RepID=UPI0036EDD671